MKPLTKEQRAAIKRVYDRSPDGAPSYLAFRRRFFQTFADCIMGKWCGMYLGIELDGYTHS